ncbi:MAG: RNA-guided endonuclease InsQ/TnpB family protein [Candidatus Micrarchaeia archaeon]
MVSIRSWKYRIYPTKEQESKLQAYLYECKNVWNFLLEHTKQHYEKTGGFPTRKQLYALTKKKTKLFSQVSQNVADKLVKALKGMFAKKEVGRTVGFPRFKRMERMKSFTYPQFGFKINEQLSLSKIGEVQIKKHRRVKGKIKTLTIKRMLSGKWFAIFTSEVEMIPTLNRGPKAGIDLGIDHFVHTSDDFVIENPRHLKKATNRIKQAQKLLSGKKRGSKNRIKAKIRVARAYEKVVNRRRDFLHKTSRKLVNSYSLIALEGLNINRLGRTFLAKHVFDCGWAEFSRMLHYKAEEAGSEIVFVDAAHTTQECSSCGSIQKKILAERWHICSCGATMHRDLNAAKNILKRATGGRREVKPVERDTSIHYKSNG